MKIAVVGDLHLNKVVYKGVMDKEYPMLPFRSADFIRSFMWIVDKCINDIKPDLFVIPGDTYDYYEPTNEIRGIFSAQLSKLTSKGIPCIILIGNHDVCKKHHALKDIQELNLKNIKVVESPKVIPNFQGVRILIFPYSLDIETKKKTLREEFKNFLETSEKNKSELPSVFFGHFGVKNAVLNEYVVSKTETEDLTDTTTTLSESKAEYFNRRASDIDSEWLDALGAEHVILGDFHKHQKLNTKKCYAMYTGSIEKTDIKEVDQKKGFIVYDSDAEIGELGKCKFVEYPNCRPIVELKGTLLEMKKKFEEMDCNINKGAVVKLSFVGNGKELLDFSSGLDEFKNYIEDKIEPIHLYSTQKEQDEVEIQEVSKLEKEILEKGHISDEDVIQVIDEMISEKIKDDSEQKATVALGREIYEEVRK